jgi:hypothetical protein
MGAQPLGLPRCATALAILVDARRPLDDGRTTKLMTAPAIAITCAINVTPKSYAGIWVMTA